MPSRIDQFITHAFEVVSDSSLVQKDTISRQYNGYIASFGASVIQSGMLAALVFNHRKTDRGEKNRLALMEVVFDVIKKDADEDITAGNMLGWYKAGNDVEKKERKQLILDVATAVKMVIRTYELVKPKQSES